MQWKSDQPCGYSIPTIDLDGDEDRQIVVDKEEGQYLGHPTTVLLDDGKTMICVYPKGHGKGAIVMKKSFDGGLSWSDRLEVPENWSTSKEVPTIYPVRNAVGTIERLIMFSGLYPIRMAVSEDLGETWTPLEPIGDYGGVVACADMLRTQNGRHMAVFHDDGRFIDNAGERCGTWTVYRILSDDGLTWSEPFALLESDGPQLCEPGLVRSPDGEQIAMLLRENSREYNSFVSFSDDEGATWSHPTELPGALRGDRHQCIYGPEGRLFVSFRDTTHETPTRGDWVGWVGTYEDIVEGREGQYRVRLVENHKPVDCAYPALERLPDDTIVATTYGHWIEGHEPFIMSVRFEMSELDEKEPMQI